MIVPEHTDERHDLQAMRLSKPSASPLRLTALAAVGVLAASLPVAAQTPQGTVSRPVVQALPPPSVGDLNDALRRLARDSRNLDALIDAGTASLQLGDLDAAIGFFGRAEELSPGNPRVKVGLAGAFVRSERPIEALRLFDEAEAAGASTLSLAGDRGLAYDLVGDNRSAQAQYRLALARRPNDELVRRLALSQAIAGDRAAFEQTLLPLLEQGDLAAYRIRAFGLAILGDEEEAVTIAEAVMPPELAAQVVSYLRYMPRLTGAQQAAAANLGIFPRAARIGRDDPRIAQYSGDPAPALAANSGSRLIPAGEPLGPRSTGRTSQASDRTSSAQAGDRRARAVERQLRAERRRAVSDPLARTTLPPQNSALPAPPFASEESALPTTPTSSALAARELPPEPRPATTIAGVDQAGVDLVQGGSPSAQASRSASVDNAFAEFALVTPSARPAPGEIDITRIKPPREVEAPAAPAHPSRVWVQVATGQNREALKFDWRRISRSAGELLANASGFVARWGDTNRLVTGPYDSADQAQDMVTKLKAEGVDSFIFTSSNGEQVEPV